MNIQVEIFHLLSFCLLLYSILVTPRIFNILCFCKKHHWVTTLQVAKHSVHICANQGIVWTVFCIEKVANTVKKKKKYLIKPCKSWKYLGVAPPLQCNVLKRFNRLDRYFSSPDFFLTNYFYKDHLVSLSKHASQ